MVSSVPQRAGARFGSSSELPALRRLGLLHEVFVTVNAFAAGIWSCRIPPDRVIELGAEVNQGGRIVQESERGTI